MSNKKKPEFETPDVQVIKAAKKRCDRVSGGFDIRWFSIEMGNNEVRVLPPIKEVTPLFKEAQYHYQIVQDDEGRDRSLLCRDTFGETCPACEWVEELAKSGSDDDSKKASRIKAKTRFFFQIIDRQDEETGVKIAMFPPSIAERIFSLLMDPNIGTITDADKGYDINIIKKRRKGSKSTGKPSFKDIEYEVNVIPDSCPVMVDEKDQVDYSWSEELANLDDVPRLYNYEDMGAMVDSGELIPWSERSDAPDEESKEERTSEETEEPGVKDTGGEDGSGLGPEDVDLVNEIRKMKKRKDLVKYCGEWNELESLDPNDYDSVEDLQTAMIEAFGLSDVEAELNKEPEPEPPPKEEEKPKRSRRSSKVKDEPPVEEDKKTTRRRRAAAKTDEPSDDKSEDRKDTSAAAKLKERSRSRGRSEKDKGSGSGTRRRRRSSSS